MGDCPSCVHADLAVDEPPCRSCAYFSNYVAKASPPPPLPKNIIDPTAVCKHYVGPTCQIGHYYGSTYINGDGKDQDFICLIGDKDSAVTALAKAGFVVAVDPGYPGATDDWFSAKWGTVNIIAYIDPVVYAVAAATAMMMRVYADVRPNNREIRVSLHQATEALALRVSECVADFVIHGGDPGLAEVYE